MGNPMTPLIFWQEDSMCDKTFWNLTRLNRLLFGFTLFLAIILAGCNPETETPEPTETFVSPLASVSPLVTSTSSSVMATPTQGVADVELLPTPVEGKATVGGAIYLDMGGEEFDPLPNVRVFLGDVHVSEDGEGRIAGYSERTSPQSVTDDQGRFVIQNVPPGTYNLIVVRYLSPVFMKDHQTDESIVFTLKAGDILNLGEIHYTATE